MDRPDRHDEQKYTKRWTGKRSKIDDILTSKEVAELAETVEPFAMQYGYFGECLGTEHTYSNHRRGRQGMQESDLKRLEREREEREFEKERRLAIALSEDATRRRQELINSRTIEITCKNCGHSHSFLFTQRARKQLAGKRFVCSHCGQKSAPFLPR